jgi:prepilin-type N-terminal cleavage/methylation domain-containing protein
MGPFPNGIPLATSGLPSTSSVGSTEEAAVLVASHSISQPRPRTGLRGPSHLPAPERTRAGFTIMEMMVVVLVIGIMTGIMVKPIAGAFAQSSRRSATREVASYLFRARSIAVQQSRASEIVRTGNVLKIRVDSSGTKVTLGQPRDLNQIYGVTLTTTAPSGGLPADTIRFDTRGFTATANATNLPKFIITRGGVDTLCVTGLGRVSSRGC